MPTPVKIKLPGTTEGNHSPSLSRAGSQQSLVSSTSLSLKKSSSSSGPLSPRSDKQDVSVSKAKATSRPGTPEMKRVGSNSTLEVKRSAHSISEGALSRPSPLSSSTPATPRAQSNGQSNGHKGAPSGRVRMLTPMNHKIYLSGASCKTGMTAHDNTTLDMLSFSSFCSCIG
jgi:hypothetical protein